MNPLIPAVIAILIAVNALYVAAEFAAVSVRRSRIQGLAESGNRLAGTLLPVVAEPARLDRYIAACQIGITLSSLVLGAYGQIALPGILAPRLEDLGVSGEAAARTSAAVIVLVGLTSLQVVLGELVPKSLALQFPTQVALYTVIPMRWSLVLFRPFIAVLNGSGLAILRLFGAAQGGHGHIHSPDEIELLIVQSGDGGVLEPDERLRLRRALRLGDRRAHEVMVPRRRIVAVDASDPPQEIERRISDSRYTRIPVYRDSVDNVIGMLHAKDLMLQILDEGNIGPIERLLRPMAVVPDSAPVYHVLSNMREARAHQAVVVDEFGGVAGLITLDDLLDEVLGDVDEGTEPSMASAEALANGCWRVQGAMRADDALQLANTEVPGSSDTIGGRVVESLGRLPEEGEVVVLGGIEILVEAIEHHSVSSLVLRPLSIRDAADE